MPEVPAGSVSTVLAWVVEAPESRAQAAYDVEQERATPRVTLLAELVGMGAVPSEPGDGSDA